MSDVFISYSRQDKEFVSQLYNALSEQNQIIWIDWESIPKAQAWWDEIKKGIADANNFVVILSPNSMASPICHMEIEYARSLKKRLIPVWYEDFDDELAIKDIGERLALPTQDFTRKIWATRQPNTLYHDNYLVLKRFNYLYFRQSDDFKVKFAELLEIIRTDHDYKSQHTVLITRSLNWTDHDRNLGYLLYFGEMEHARRWRQVAENTDKSPKPTELQLDYIVASIRATRVLQTIFVAAAVFSLVAIIATITSVKANEQAQSANTAVAYANATLTPIPITLNAISTQIQNGQNTIDSQKAAAVANGILTDPRGQPETAALLAIRALKIGYSPQADAVLQAAIDKLPTRQIYVGHTNTINSVAISPDGRMALSGSSDDTLRLWDLESGKTLRTFTGHTGAVTSVAFTPDGRSVVSGSEDFTVRLWDIFTGKTLRIFSSPMWAVTNLAISPDSTTLLAGNLNIDHPLIQFDLASGKVLHDYTDIESDVNNLTFSPDGKIFAYISARSIVLRDTQTASIVHDVTANEVGVSSIAFLPNGKTLVAGAGGSIEFWDISSGKILNTFSAGTLLTTSLVYLPSNDTFNLATSEKDGTIRLWNFEYNQNIAVFSGHTGSVNSLALSPDGKYILSGSDDGTLRLWTLTGYQPGYLLPFYSNISTNISISPNEKSVVNGSADNNVRLWDISNGQTLRVFSGHTSQVTSTAFSPDGKTILSGSFDKTLRLWDVTTGQNIRVFSGHTDAVTSIAFAPDGKTVVSASRDKTLRLWDVTTGQTVRVFSGHTDEVTSVAMAPDGKTVLSASRDKTLRLWDVTTGQPIRVFSGHTDAVTSVAFASDGKTAVTSSLDNTIRLWNISSGQTISIIPVKGISQAIFSPDNKEILSSSDRTLQLWDIGTKQLLRVFSDYRPIVGITFASDGKTILSTNLGTHIRMWKTDYRDYIQYACTRIFRDLTMAERNKFNIYDNELTCPQFAGELSVAYASQTPTLIYNNGFYTPLPPTTTPVPNLDLPIWTPIASPTSEPTNSVNSSNGLLTITPPSNN